MTLVGRLLAAIAGAWLAPAAAVGAQLAADCERLPPPAPRTAPMASDGACPAGSLPYAGRVGAAAVCLFPPAGRAGAAGPADARDDCRRRLPIAVTHAERVVAGSRPAVRLRVDAANPLPVGPHAPARQALLVRGPGAANAAGAELAGATVRVIAPAGHAAALGGAACAPPDCVALHVHAAALRTGTAALGLHTPGRHRWARLLLVLREAPPPG